MKLPVFKNKQLFTQAFTHRSFLNESKQKIESNERLEFLGDSIVSFLVSKHLFDAFPHFNEGQLTNLRSLLVNTKSLAQLAQQLEFGQYLRLSKGEEDSKGRENESLLADAFEAFVGALLADQGIEVVTKFVEDTVLRKIDSILKKKSLKDPKSLLQEYVQAQKQSSPVYKVLAETGPAHAKYFTIGVFVKSKLIGQGTGKSKQQGEEEAARIALDYFLNKNP